MVKSSRSDLGNSVLARGGPLVSFICVDRYPAVSAEVYRAVLFENSKSVAQRRENFRAPFNQLRLDPSVNH